MVLFNQLVENRKKYPKNKAVVDSNYPKQNKYTLEAFEYVEKNFKTNLGELSTIINYPNTFEEAENWFMEFFIDAYDWVMVTNIYGMSQFADGGMMSTKPYISGSNYLMKMSDYPKGEWQETWDALFWRFLDVHREVFLKNPRLGMLVKTYDKWPEEKKIALRIKSEGFLSCL